MTAESPLTDDERAQLNCDCYKDWRGYHVDTCCVPVVVSILLARETALRETIAQEIREREAKAWEAGGIHSHTCRPESCDGNPYRLSEAGERP